MAEALLPPASTTRKGVNPSKFMGASFAAGSGLEKRVENNERKITSLKNIIKLRKVNVDKLLPASSDGQDKDQTIITNNLTDRLDNIAQSLGVLTRALKQQFNVDKKAADQDKRDADEAQKKDRERNLEAGRGAKFVGGVTSAITKPFQGFFDSLINFFKNILLGAGLLALIKWLKEPENQAKIKAFWDFITTTLPELIEKIIEGAKTIGNRIGALLTLLGKSIIGTYNAGRRTRMAWDKWWRNFRKPPSKPPRQLKLDLDKKKPPKKVKTIKKPSWLNRKNITEASKVTGKVSIWSLLMSLGGSSRQQAGTNEANDWLYRFLPQNMRGPDGAWSNFISLKMQPHLPELIKLSKSDQGAYEKRKAELFAQFRREFILANPELQKRPGVEKFLNSPFVKQSSLQSGKLSSNQNLKSTNIGTPMASNNTQIINLGGDGAGQQTVSETQGGNDVDWFPSSSGNRAVITASINGAVNAVS